MVVKPAISMRGPSTMPASMALRTAHISFTSSPYGPFIPRSRSVVKPMSKQFCAWKRAYICCRWGMVSNCATRWLWNVMQLCIAVWMWRSIIPGITV